MRDSKAGPTAPTAWLLFDHEQADKQKLSDEETRELLAALPASHDQLAKGYRHLIYALARDSRRGATEPNAYREHQIGPMFLALWDAIPKLDQHEDPTKYLLGVLKRAAKKQAAEDSDHINVPPSTNSTRKRNGQQPHQTLKRQRAVKVRPSDPANKPYYVDPMKTIADKDTPSINEHEMALTPLEKTVVGMLRAGHSERDIATSLSITRAQVRRIIAIVRSIAA